MAERCAGRYHSRCCEWRPPALTLPRLTMDEPWYRDGLRFRCTRCGHCCTGAPGYVWVNEAEITALAQHRGETVEEITALYVRPVGRRSSLREKANGDCVFYDRVQGCTVYAV